MLTTERSRRATLVATVVAGLVVGTAACSGATGDRTPGRPVPVVAVEHRLFSLSWEGDDVCLRGRFPTLPACLPVDARSTEPVLSAVLQPLYPAADLLVVVTRPEVVLAGLGPGVVRTVMAAADGDGHVAVSVALRAAPTPKVCARVHVGRPGGAGRAPGRDGGRRTAGGRCRRWVLTVRPRRCGCAARRVAATGTRSRACPPMPQSGCGACTAPPSPWWPWPS